MTITEHHEVKPAVVTMFTNQLYWPVFSMYNQLKGKKTHLKTVSEPLLMLMKARREKQACEVRMNE